MSRVCGRRGRYVGGFWGREGGGGEVLGMERGMGDRLVGEVSERGGEGS